MKEPIKEPLTTVIAFRVPNEIAVQLNTIADDIPRGTVSKVVKQVFLPAFDRYLKKREKAGENKSQ